MKNSFHYLFSFLFIVEIRFVSFFSQPLDQDIEELRTRFLNRDFDEISFEIDGQSFAAYAEACGELDPRFTDPQHDNFQAPPTYVSTLVGGRMLPEDFPRLPGLPSYEATVAQWEQVSGFSARDYGYYQIFAGMRYGLILSRIMLATGQHSEVQGNFACALLQRYLDRLAG